MDIKKQFGKRIAQLRKYQNLSQEKLAEMCDINVNSLSYIETGKSFPSYDTFENITKALKVNPKELFNFAEAIKNEDLIMAINAKVQIVKNDNEKLKQIYAYLDSVI